MKLSWCLCIVIGALILGAQTLIRVPAEVTCDSAAHAVSTSGLAVWVQFIAPAANSAVVRVGDSNVSATRGFPIAAGGGYNTPVLGQGNPRYDLTKIFYYCTTGDKVVIGWAQ